MVTFPERCITTLNEAITSRRLLPIKFELVSGKHEAYQYAKIVQKNLLIELYVYADEAGCKLNERDWKIFEKWDFSDDSELIQRFVAYVISVLTTGPGVKDNSPGWHGFSLVPEGG